jgi:hypothetical protein
MDPNVVDAAKSFAVEQLSSNLHPQIKFHDLQHTQTVVEASLEIGKGEGVSENDLRILEVAAWFHDLGYSQRADGHEKIGAQMAREFLHEQNVDDPEIKNVERIILSTEVNTKPKDKLEEIIRDADMAHLGMKDSRIRSLLLREEKEAMSGESYSDTEWLEINYSFFKNHRYNTHSAQIKYGPKKEEYMQLMHKSLIRRAGGQ